MVCVSESSVYERGERERDKRWKAPLTNLWGGGWWWWGGSRWGLRDGRAHHRRGGGRTLAHGHHAGVLCGVTADDDDDGGMLKSSPPTHTHSLYTSKRFIMCVDALSLCSLFSHRCSPTLYCKAVLNCFKKNEFTFICMYYINIENALIEVICLLLFNCGWSSRWGRQQHQHILWGCRKNKGRLRHWQYWAASK